MSPAPTIGSYLKIPSFLTIFAFFPNPEVLESPSPGLKDHIYSQNSSSASLKHQNLNVYSKPTLFLKPVLSIKAFTMSFQAPTSFFITSLLPLFPLRSNNYLSSWPRAPSLLNWSTASALDSEGIKKCPSRQGTVTILKICKTNPAFWVHRENILKKRESIAQLYLDILLKDSGNDLENQV